MSAGVHFQSVKFTGWGNEVVNAERLHLQHKSGVRVDGYAYFIFIHVHLNIVEVIKKIKRSTSIQFKMYPQH